MHPGRYRVEVWPGDQQTWAFMASLPGANRCDWVASSPTTSVLWVDTTPPAPQITNPRTQGAKLIVDGTATDNASSFGYGSFEWAIDNADAIGLASPTLRSALTPMNCAPVSIFTPYYSDPALAYCGATGGAFWTLKTPGTYTVTLKATDQAGNVATTTRTVAVAAWSGYVPPVGPAPPPPPAPTTQTPVANPPEPTPPTQAQLVAAMQRDALLATAALRVRGLTRLANTRVLLVPALSSPSPATITLDLVAIPTFGEWAQQVMETVWLRHSPRTRQTRMSVYRLYVESDLAAVDLVDVTAPVVEAWLADLKRRDVSLHMQRHAYDIVRTITNVWYEQAGVPNPIASVKRPITPPSQEKRAKDCTITAKQYQQVIAVCKTTAEELMIRVATEAGLRIGEICGLQRRDIDLSAKTITVRRQGNRNTTKTGQVRIITMVSQGLVEAFTRHLADMDERGEIEPDSYIWRGGNPHHADRPNRPYERQGIYRIIKRVLARVDLDKVTRPHGLRATGAQLLIEAGASMELVSQHLGHATVRTTEEYYVGSVKTTGLARFDQAFG